MITAALAVLKTDEQRNIISDFFMNLAVFTRHFVKCNISVIISQWILEFFKIF